MTKSRTTARRKNRRRKGRNPLRRLPIRLLWAILLLAAAIYVFFLYKTFVGPYSFRWKALYGHVTYPAGSVRGIDVSHYQQQIDWERLRNANIQGAPLSFVIIKATEGTDRFDQYFNRNFALARRNGIVRGAYHFFSSQSPACQQADYFCRMVQLEPGDLPPVLDVETGVDNPERYPRQQLRREVLTWLRRVENHYGVRPILYTSYKFRLDYLSGSEFDRYPFWIAHYYVDSLQYKGPWVFWQHTDAGRVDGINGYVDINLFNGGRADLDSLLIPEPE